MTYQLYTKPGCPYCVQAKQLLEFHDLEYEIFTLGEDFDRDEFLSMTTNHKTYPLIFVVENDTRKYIGGFNALEDYLEDIL